MAQKALSLALGVTLALTGTCYPYPIKKSQAIKAIIGEAENQGRPGMQLVAAAIKNRGTLKGVYGLNNPRVVKHLYSAKIYAQAAWAWKHAEDVRLALQGAAFWENTKAFGLPYWAKGKRITFVYLDHKFFK